MNPSRNERMTRYAAHHHILDFAGKQILIGIFLSHDHMFDFRRVVKYRKCNQCIFYILFIRYGLL